MSAEVTAPGSESRSGGKGRSIVVVILFIIATLLTPVATIGQWGHKTVIDSEAYIATVGPLINDPAVQDSIATAITNAISSQVDTKSTVQGLLDNLIPNSTITQGLSAPIAMGINGLIGDLVHKFVASPQFAKTWIALNTAAQKGVVRILEGKDGGAVQLQGDDLVLDISSALTIIQQHLVEQGIPLVDKVTIPPSDRQIVLAKAPGLRQIQTIYGFTNPLLSLLPAIAALIFAVAIALSRRRSPWVIATGIVAVVWAVVILFALQQGQDAFSNQLANTVFGPASTVFFDTLLRYLVAGLKALALLGVISIVAGWFAGRSRPASAIRTPVTRGLAELGSKVPAAQLGTFVRRYFTALCWIVYVVVGFFLLRGGLISMSQVVWASLLAVGLVSVLTALRSAGETRA
jgi:hypothetical protein